MSSQGPVSVLAGDIPDQGLFWEKPGPLGVSAIEPHK